MPQQLNGLDVYIGLSK